MIKYLAQKIFSFLGKLLFALIFFFFFMAFMGRWGMRDDFTLDGKVSYEEYSLVVVVFALSYLLAHALIAGFRRDELKDWRIRIEKAEPEIPRLKDMVTPRHIEIVEKTFLQKKSSRRKGRLQADSNDISRGEST